MRLFEAHNRRGGFLLQLPEYRPDLAHRLAHSLDLTFFDYRVEVMSELGWNAHSLSLDDLDKTLIERATAGGLVAQNVEALLATKSVESRTEWLQRFVDRPWPHLVLVPLCVFAHEAPRAHSHCYECAADMLPAQSFIGRLADLANVARE